MDTVGRWWNGNWGRLGRRDVFLRLAVRWEVEARLGGPEGRSRTWQFDTEEAARAFVKRCLVGPGTWRELKTDVRQNESQGTHE